MKSIRFSLLVLALALAVPANATDRVRIVVAGLFHPQQLVVEASPAQPLLLSADGRESVIGTGAHQSVTITRSAEALIISIEGRSIRASHAKFAARQGGDSVIELAVPGKLRRLYRGQLTVTPRGNGLVAVVEMDLETAVASIVAAESPAGAPMEALKAQAVVSRSFLVAGGPRHADADFCDTTHCQFLREPPAPASAAARASTATHGLVLAWQGKTFAAMYSASCGGRTHTLAEAGLADHGYPYFAVECHYCRRSPERWTSELLQQDAASLRSNSENERVKIGRKLGWSAIPSNTYETEQVEAGVKVTGRGRGHGIGLCQRGAAGMAHDGNDFRTILEHYFPNSVIQSLP